MSLRVSIDIGGGFTDLVGIDEKTGEMLWSKTRTTPDDLSRCVKEVFELSKIDARKLSQLLHGQTVVINAIVQRKGAKVGLITTKGFKDILSLQRSNRRDIFNLRYKKPEPFVPKDRRFEVDERTMADGEVLRKLDEKEFLDAYRKLIGDGVEAVAVCFLNSYVNPTNEKKALELVKYFHDNGQAAHLPYLCISSDISREWREYERTNTCVLNAYVMPLMERYLTKLDREFRDLGTRGTLYMMVSSGGVASFEFAAKHPIETVESGPVAGVVGAVALAELIGEKNIIAFDGGSTTTKASLVEDCQIRFTTDYYVERDEYSAGYPIKVPVVDITEIGIGGGSIAWFDDVGTLKVGPLNAAAVPGPACYGLGGTQPTLTDAYVALGMLNPGYFLGGALKVHKRLAENAVAGIAERLEISVEEAAFGIVRVANNKAAQLLSLISVQRGYDPRDFALVAYGGSGPMIVPFVASELEIPKIIIPKIPPGNFSAWGLLMSDLKHSAVRTMVKRLDTTQFIQLLNDGYVALEHEVLNLYREEGVKENVILKRTADLRYYGQEHTVKVPLPDGPLTEKGVSQLSLTFNEQHTREYGFCLKSPVELVNIQVTGVIRVTKPAPKHLRSPARNASECLSEERERMVYWGPKGRVTTPIYRRDLLPSGAQICGPAIIEESTTTVIVPNSFEVSIDPFGNIVIKVNQHGS